MIRPMHTGAACVGEGLGLGPADTDTDTDGVGADGRDGDGGEDRTGAVDAAWATRNGPEGSRAERDPGLG